MNEVMTIQGTDVTVKEWRGKRVVTFADIDRVHQRPEGTARKRFNDNRGRFISGVDFYKVKCCEVRSFFGQTPPNGFNPKNDITLITESGYLMLVKSFTDDIAWKVQRELVDSYFRPREVKDYTTVIETDKLIKCGEIMAGCLEGNRPYVVAILRNIFPGLDDVEKAVEHPQEDSRPQDKDVTGRAPTDRANRKPPSAAGYLAPFDSKLLRDYLQEGGIRKKDLEKMIGCGKGSVSGWTNGQVSPGAYYRVKICEALELPQGYFDKGRRRRRR